VPDVVPQELPIPGLTQPLIHTLEFAVDPVESAWYNLATILSLCFMLNLMLFVFNLIPLPPFDGYNALEPFLNPIIREQVDRLRGATMWVILLLFWYVPFVSNGFWNIVYVFSRILGANWDLVVMGLDRFRFWQL